MLNFKGNNIYIYIHYKYGCKSKCRSGSTPKTHRRSRPAIQTDPDRSRPHDPDLWSRPLCFMLVGHVLFQSTEKYYVLCTTKYDAGWSREFWKNLAIPFQTSFQTVPDPFQTSSMESKGSVHSQPCCPRRKNRSVRPVQNHLIQFKSYMKWLSWFQALRSRRAEKTFYESGRSRRPDHRGTIQTRLSTHAHIPRCWMYGIFTYIYHKFRPNVGKYTLYWVSGIYTSIPSPHVVSTGHVEPKMDSNEPRQLRLHTRSPEERYFHFKGKKIAANELQ